MNIYVKQNFNILNETAEIAHFHFLPYKSMETSSYHSNQSSWTKKIKNTNFVQANVISMHAKFQLHPPYGFWEEDFWIFFSKIYPLCCYSSQTNKVIFYKSCLKREGLLNKHLCKKQNSNIPSLTTENANFHFSPYKSMETSSCHSNQSSYPIEIKKHKYSFPPPVDAICEIWKKRPGSFRGEVVWKCWRRRTMDDDDDRRRRTDAGCLPIR